MRLRILVLAGFFSLVLAGTGSEVALAMEAAVALERHGTGVRVVSLPCAERFIAQPARYREAVLPRGVPVLGVEAGHPMGRPAFFALAKAGLKATLGGCSDSMNLSRKFAPTIQKAWARRARSCRA